MRELIFLFIFEGSSLSSVGAKLRANIILGLLVGFAPFTDIPSIELNPFKLPSWHSGKFQMRLLSTA